MTSPTSKRLAAVVLAAGSSTRLGRPKQLVDWHGKTLVRRAAELALAHSSAGVTVVTGAEADKVAAGLDGLPLGLAYNCDWETGMGSSLRTGIHSISESVNIDALLVMLCDQPRLTDADITSLVEAWQIQPDKPSAAGYNNTVGVPAIIPFCLLGELVDLPPDRGAGGWLRDHSDVSVVGMSNADLDIDTIEDLQKLLEE
jgi:molybdenum cofactor cytidylyltransferase